MSREWKPGDLALVSSWRGADLPAFRVRRDGCGTVWCVLQDGDTRGLSDTEVGVSARPLVVIDPEDREQVERLGYLYYAGINGQRVEGSLLDEFQRALREYANPTPPKPEEPTGLGAVVEDAVGFKWVRWQRRTTKCWRREDDGATYASWADVKAVEVLSEGVQA